MVCPSPIFIILKNNDRLSSETNRNFFSFSDFSIAIPVLRTNTECYLDARGNLSTLSPANMVSLQSREIMKHVTTVTTSVSAKFTIPAALHATSTISKIIFDHWLGIIGLYILIRLFLLSRYLTQRHNEAINFFTNYSQKLGKLGTISEKLTGFVTRKIKRDAIQNYRVQATNKARNLVQNAKHKTVTIGKGFSSLLKDEATNLYNRAESEAQGKVDHVVQSARNEFIAMKDTTQENVALMETAMKDNVRIMKENAAVEVQDKIDSVVNKKDNAIIGMKNEMEHVAKVSKDTKEELITETKNKVGNAWQSLRGKKEAIIFDLKGKVQKRNT